MKIQLDQALCTKCKKCESDCPSIAISIDTATIDDTCIKCGHCIAICPERAMSFDGSEVFPLKPFDIKTDDLINLFAHNRTIRKFSDKDVDPSDLRTLLNVLKHYGSASNRRDIKITAIESRKRIADLDTFVFNDLHQYFQKLSKPLMYLFVSLFKGHKNAQKIKKYSNKFNQRAKENRKSICFNAPLVLIFHATDSPLSMNETDSAIWAANTVTLARTMNLGHCYNGFIKIALNRNKSMKPKFGIPSENKVFLALLLGYSRVEYVNECGRINSEITLLSD